jgi:hypothetical protein
MNAIRIVLLVACMTLSLTGTPITGGQLIIPGITPGSLAVGAFEDGEFFYLIEEVAGFTNAAPFSAGVMGGVIPAGTTSNFYIIHADPIESTTTYYSGTVTFDAPIIGLYVGSSTLNLLDPVVLALGSPVSTYPTGWPNRGLEVGQGFGDSYILSNGNMTLTLNFATGPDVDQLRVVVAAIPEPATVVLFGLGAAALILFRRLRR